MPKLLGIDIPNNKHINVSLTYLYGIGPATADKICAMAGIVNNIARKTTLSRFMFIALTGWCCKYTKF